MDKKGTGQKGHKCLFLIPQRGAVRNSHRSDTLTLDNIYKHQNKNQMHFKVISLHTG